MERRRDGEGDGEGDEERGREGRMAEGEDKERLRNSLWVPAEPQFTGHKRPIYRLMFGTLFSLNVFWHQCIKMNRNISVLTSRDQ